MTAPAAAKPRTPRKTRSAGPPLRPIDMLAMDGFRDMLENVAGKGPDGLGRYLTEQSYRDAERERLPGSIGEWPERSWPGLAEHAAEAEAQTAADCQKISYGENAAWHEHTMSLDDRDFIAALAARQPQSTYPIEGQEPEASWLLGAGDAGVSAPPEG